MNDNDFVLLKNGKYLRKDDAHYWEKFLENTPDHPEALYHVAIHQYNHASRIYEISDKTKEDVEDYYKEIKETKQMLKKAADAGFPRAKDAMDKIDNAYFKTNPKQQEKNKKKENKKFLIPVIISLFLILATLFLFFLFKDKPIETIIKNNDYFSLVPYEVIYQNPPKESQDFEKIIIKSKNSIVEDTLNQFKEIYQSKIELPVQVHTYQNGKLTAVGIWKDKDAPIHIFILTNKESFRELWLNTTVIRSSIFQYIKQEGKFPEQLVELTKEFPENYLTAIPKESITESNPVRSLFTGEGGWVYSPPSLSYENDEELIELVRLSLIPNVSVGIIPFEPLKIHVSKKTNKIRLYSGSQLILEEHVALGKNNATPTGDFFVRKKIFMPNSNTPLPSNPYGTRSLEFLPEYAIHGTNQPSQIGKNVSHGCIRMNNASIEKLYSLTPLYTPIEIGSSEEKLGEMIPLSSPIQIDSELSQPTSKENSPNQKYQWLF